MTAAILLWQQVVRVVVPMLSCGVWIVFLWMWWRSPMLHVLLCVSLCLSPSLHRALFCEEIGNSHSSTRLQADDLAAVFSTHEFLLNDTVHGMALWFDCPTMGLDTGL